MVSTMDKAQSMSLPEPPDTISGDKRAVLHVHRDLKVYGESMYKAHSEKSWAFWDKVMRQGLAVIAAQNN